MNARICAVNAITQVVTGGRSLSAALPEQLDMLPDSAQRSLAQELSFGVLRWYFRLDGIARLMMQRPLRRRDQDVYSLLLSGLYQLSFMDIPPHAAVHETVQVTKEMGKPWAAKLVNALLRSFQRQIPRFESAVEKDEVMRLAHPRWLLDTFRRDWPDFCERIARANNERPPMSLRVNALRMERHDYMKVLSAAGLQAVPLPHVPCGLRLEKAVPVALLPGFQAGDVSVQDGAAQLTGKLLQVREGMRILDACAAPGGKTCQLLEQFPALDITALDIDENRLERIAENLRRLGLQARLVAGDAAKPDGWWDGRLYDRILLDVPCSATGVIRRHPDIRVLRLPGDIESLTGRQAGILAAVWPLLAPGGILLYVTCSVLKSENTQQVSHYVDCKPDAEELVIDSSWGHACTFGRQILPGEDDMDGFYFACLKKRKC